MTNVTSSAERVAIQAAGAKGPAATEALTSPAGSLTATTGVTLGGQTISPQTGQLTGTQVRSQVTPHNGIYDITVGTGKRHDPERQRLGHGASSSDRENPIRRITGRAGERPRREQRPSLGGSTTA